MYPEYHDQHQLKMSFNSLWSHTQLFITAQVSFIFETLLSYNEIQLWVINVVLDGKPGPS